MAIPSLTGRQGKTGSWLVTVPQDLTGWAPRWVVKPRLSWRTASTDADAVLVAAVGSGLVLTPGVSSTIAITITAAAMAAVAADVYVWEMQLTKAGEVRLVEWDTDGTTLGTLTVEPSVVKVTP